MADHRAVGGKLDLALLARKISAMKALLRKFWPRDTPRQPPLDVRMAVAQLLLEIARADRQADEQELGVIREHLGHAFGLTQAQLDAALATAREHVEHAVSLYETVETVNRELDAGQKAALMGALWGVAFADGRVDPYEESLLRRLADLMYVPHSVFIREKLRRWS
jgi:uncharacterized tellurite resistance protein B-like protein